MGCLHFHPVQPQILNVWTSWNLVAFVLALTLTLTLTLALTLTLTLTLALATPWVLGLHCEHGRSAASLSAISYETHSPGPPSPEPPSSSFVSACMITHDDAQTQTCWRRRMYLPLLSYVRARDLHKR